MEGDLGMLFVVDGYMLSSWKLDDQWTSLHSSIRDGVDICLVGDWNVHTALLLLNCKVNYQVDYHLELSEEWIHKTGFRHFNHMNLTRCSDSVQGIP